MFKRLFMLFFVFLVAASMQANAQQLNYQAIARNANGVALTFRDVGIRLSIRDGSPVGSIVYSESRNIRTNQFGLFTVIIGSPGASNVMGSMASINWISGNKYLQVEIDPEGGTNYFQAGTSQLQAVPYALFANAAYPVGPAGGDLLGSSYPNPIIAPLVITTGKIANQAITTPKIADLNVTTAKLEDQAVTNPKIADNTIANIKLVNSRVTLNGLVLNLGDVQDFAVGNNGTDVNIVSAGNTHTFNFPDATSFSRGLVTTVAQTFGGNKTFNNDITATRIIRAGGIAAQFLKADGSVDNNIYLTENQPIIVTATGDATGVSTSSRTAPVLPLTLATVNSAVGTYGTNLVIPSITVNNKGLVTNVVTNPIPTATATINGLLNTGDWNRFNNKQNAISLGTTAQYFRGDLTLSNFQTDVRNQLSAGTNITYNNGNIGLTNNSVTLNTLPLTLGGSQTFATGTTGVDFNISSVGSVHTFNIPTASVFARGLLSSSDYTNFNAAFTNRISSLTTTGTSGPATLSANVLNIPNYTYTLPAATATILGGIISGANITNTSGTISVTSNNVINALGSQTANRFLVAPNGSNGLPTFRAMATGDIPDNIVTNIKLANSNIILGTTNIPLGGTANSLLGLTSVTSGAFVGPLTGNASTASTWANARTISTTGDVLYTSNPFDGSGNTTGVATLANSGVTPGSYGSASSIPSFTVDAKGRINSATSFPISGVSTLGSALTNGNIIIGSAANIAAQVPVTGDVTLSNAGVTTIGALKVTDAMLAGGITDGKLATISTPGKVSNFATTATPLNIINTIVSRDGSGNFSAGTITANLTGNVTGNVTGNATGTAANVTGIVLGANGGTGVANTGRTMTLGGNIVTAGDLTTAGAFATTLTSTAATNVTLPTTGTLATLVGAETLTNKTIAAASNTISGLTNANLSGTAGITDANLTTISTAGKVANSATTATATNTNSTIVLRDGSGNFSAGTITANLTGNVTGNVTGNATGTAANVTGIVLGANGGTGVANTGRTMTLGGNIVTAGDLTTAGGFATTLTSTAATNVTLPTTGTLATLAGTETLTNKTLTTPTINNPVISFTNSNAIVAGTDAQGSGPITNDLNIITTAASSPSGITLPSATAGRRVIVVNRGTNPVKVYPVLGGQIDALGNNNAYSNIPVNGYLEFYATSSTQWYTSSNATSASQWNVVGNSALDASVNFLGTIDNSPLRFRVNSGWAGEINPTKSTNASYGIGAMNNSFAGTNNTAMGNSSLLNIGNGIGNTGFGFETLKAVTTSSLSTAVGAGALSKNDGAQNTAIGAGALTENTTGVDNTAVGQAALTNANGQNNTAIGQNALNTGSSITNNTAVGQATLFSSIGNNNTAIGRAALENAAAGDDNTAIGYLAGRNYGELFVLGDVATNITKSVMIGSNTRTATNISDNEIVIGHNAVGNGSNTVQLGNTSITTVKTAGVINAAGSIFSLAAKNSNYTLTDLDYYIKITASAIMTLPSASNRLGRKFVIFNHHSGSNTVNSASNIIGFGNTTNSISVFTMRSLIVISDGTNWLIESNSF